MKKIFAVFMSVLLILTMVPTLAFAEVEHEWIDYGGREVGDVIQRYERICEVSFDTEPEDPLTVYVEVNGVTPADYEDSQDVGEMEWSYNNGTMTASVTADWDNSAYCSSPVLAVLDEVDFDAESDELTYRMHKIDAFEGYFRGVGEATSEGEGFYDLMPGEGKTLTVNASFFEDKEHQKPMVIDGTRVDFTETYTTRDGYGTGIAPVGMIIDDVSYDEEKNELSFACSKYLWNELDIFSEKGELFSKGEMFGDIQNYQAKDLTVEYIVYHDKELTEPVEEDGYYYKETISCGERQQESFVMPEAVIYAGYIDQTMEKEPKLTIEFYCASAEITEEDYDRFERLKAQAEDVLETVSADSISLKIADPEELNIDGYTEDDVESYITESMMLSRELDLPDSLYDEKEGQTFGTSVSLWADIYTDEEMTQSAEAYDEENDEWSLHIEPNTTYYLDVSYLIYTSCGNGISLDDTVSLGRPIEISYEYVPVGENTDEVEQIKKIGNMELNYIVDDLCWINTLVTAGFDAYIPSVKNTEAFLRAGNPGLYEQLIGNTDLEVVTEYGRAGDAFSFIGETSARPYYYVDDVFYGTGGTQSYRNRMYIANALYVPEGTTDRAAAAEERIDHYLDGGAYEATVSSVTDPQEMLDLWLASAIGEEEEEWIESEISPIRDQAKAAYLTKYGVAFYSDETSTAKEDFLTTWMICGESEFADQLFENSSLEEVGTLDYIAHAYDEFEKTDVHAYAPYKLTLTNTAKDESQDYLYAIAIGDEDKLREPYAEWKDDETNIITKSENGYVPFDAYTKIRVIKDGKEIKFIQDKVGNDKKVHAYDINAYTNFKGGKLQDLGDGLMKVMIPLGVLSEDGVKAHYVDEEGNVQDLEFNIEEYEGMKYVSFLTNHFSVYAISGVEEGTGEAPTHSKAPDTGDHANLIGWIMAACLGIYGGFTLRKRETGK